MNGEEKNYADVLEEITILRQRNAELEAQAAEYQQAEARFRLLVENATDFISCHTPEGEYRYASPACRTLLGYEPEDLVGHSAYEFIHPEDQAAIAASHTTILEHPMVSTASYRIRRKDGTYIWFETTSHAICAEQTEDIVEIYAASRDITARRQMEAALRESRAMLKQILDTIPQSVFWKDTEGVYLGCNQVFATAVGISAPEDIIGKTDFDLPWPRHEAEAYRADDAFVIASQTPRRHIIEPLQQADGVRLWIDTTKQPLADSHGDVYGVLGVYDDITERKRIEEALRESEERYRAIIESQLDLVSRYRPDTTLTFVNDACCRFYGKTRAELIGQSYTFMVAPEFRDLVRQETENLAQNPRQLVGEYLNYRQDGKECWIQWVVQCICDEHGHVVELQAVGRDITDRKRMEEALEKRIVALTQPLETAEDIAFEDLFNLADIQHLQDLYAKAFGVAALITSPDGTPITQPSNFTELCGGIIRKTQKGAENCNYSDATIGRYNPSGPNIRPCLSAGLCNAGASISVGGRHIANWLIGQVRNETQDEEEIIPYAREIGADEAAFRAAYRNVPVMSQEQFENVAQVLFVLANQLSTSAYQNVQQARFITERTQAGKEIRKLNSELEQRVQQRTLALETVNKELESFAYVISHDLKAPLRAISRLTTWLVTDYAPAFDEKGKDMADLLVGRVKRMDALIEGLLEYSRVGRIESECARIDLNRLVTEVVDSLAPPARIQIRLADTLPRIVASKIRLTQVFQNLIGNAIKFMDKPQGEILIDCTDEESCWKFSVTDNGPGIEPKYHDRIFQIFQTLHPRDKIESTGIGLAVVKKIVELYGGKIGMASEVGKGSTFWWTFPKRNQP